MPFTLNYDPQGIEEEVKTVRKHYQVNYQKLAADHFFIEKLSNEFITNVDKNIKDYYNDNPQKYNYSGQVCPISGRPDGIGIANNDTHLYEGYSIAG